MQSRRFRYVGPAGIRERNIVRDADYTCALCDGALPDHWNFAPDRSSGAT